MWQHFLEQRGWDGYMMTTVPCPEQQDPQGTPGTPGAMLLFCFWLSSRESSILDQSIV